TDISEITRKPSKTSKHGHENGRVYKSRKPKPEKVKSTVNSSKSKGVQELLSKMEGLFQSNHCSLKLSLKYKGMSAMEKHTNEKERAEELRPRIFLNSL
ncbi:hypothetical protein Tco_1171622, partial [Tanacetum coccineum]